jgi:hypothetical protein
MRVCVSVSGAFDLMSSMSSGVPGPQGFKHPFETGQLARDLGHGNGVEGDVHLDAAGAEVRARRAPLAACSSKRRSASIAASSSALRSSVPTGVKMTLTAPAQMSRVQRITRPLTVSYLPCSRTTWRSELRGRRRLNAGVVGLGPLAQAKRRAIDRGATLDRVGGLPWFDPHERWACVWLDVFAV